MNEFDRHKQDNADLKIKIGNLKLHSSATVELLEKIEVLTLDAPESVKNGTCDVV